MALHSSRGMEYRESRQERAHAQSLLPLIDELLQGASLALQDLDKLVLCHGPGSFTGLRIAVSVAQGLAYGAQKPVACLSSLQALSLFANKTDEAQLCCAALDARMGEVYWQVFKMEGEHCQEVNAPSLHSQTDFCSKLAHIQSEWQLPMQGLGSGFAVVETECCLSVNAEAYPRADHLIAALQGGQFKISEYQHAHEIEPLYLRNEVAWKKRERIRETSL